MTTEPGHHPLFDPATFPVAPGRRRMIVAFDVTDDDLDKHDLATMLDGLHRVIDDPTVWEWKAFWQDVDDEQVSRDHDFTSVRNNDGDNTESG